MGDEKKMGYCGYSAGWSEIKEKYLCTLEGRRGRSIVSPPTISHKGRGRKEGRQAGRGRRVNSKIVQGDADLDEWHDGGEVSI